MKSLDEIESLIRQGEVAQASQELSRQSLSSLQRKHYAQFANLARRAGAPQLSLRLLTPIVRPDVPRAKPASLKEKSEYAMALSRVGAHSEALRILESIPADAEVESLLYRALCHFLDWNYEPAIPLLRKYSEAIKDPYQRLVGQVNLAAAYVSEGHSSEAEALLPQLLKETKRQNLMRLYGNANELTAQLELDRGNFKQARASIERATSVLRSAGSLDLFYVRKWDAIIEAYARENMKPLKALRQEAVNLGSWETVRDCDFKIAKVNEDHALFLKVYFGTGAPGFKRRIEKEVGTQNIPETYTWTRDSISDAEPLFDIAAGKCKSKALRRGFALHRILTALTSDLYRPFAPATLFDKVFSDENYSFFRSPARVQQLVFRLREWLTAANVPLAITEHAGLYRVVPGARIGLVKHKDAPVETALGLRLQQVRARFGASAFTLKQFQLELQVSKRQSIRLIQKACADGLVTAEGRAFKLK